MPTKRIERADNGKRASIYLSAPTVCELAPLIERVGGNMSAATRLFLDWGVKCLQAGRTELHDVFSLSQWRALADAFNGTHLEPSLWPHLHEEWREADENGELSRKWGVDGNETARVLHGLSPAARWAFCDVLLRIKTDVTNETLRDAGVMAKEEETPCPQN